MADKKLTDEGLGLLVDRKAEEAVGWYNSKLSTEREKVIEYYNGNLPKRTSNGSSSYVSTDVYDAVESMKAQLLETFAAGHRIARFDPTTPDDVQPAAQATAYTDYVIFQQNDAYGMFGQMIDDGLKARVGVCKVWWDECIEHVDEEFEDASEEQVMELASKDDVEDLDATETADGSGLYTGKISRKVDKSQVRFEVINPEEFSVEPQAKCLGKDTFCVQQSIKTVDELIRAGYDEEKVRSYNCDDDTVLAAHPEVLARFKAIDSGLSKDRTDEESDMRAVLVTEAYIKVKMDTDKHAKLYKVVRLGDQTLEKVEVEEIPFLAFVPLPVPHMFYGNNFAARVIPAQNARTVLMRSILDHTAITTNPRYQVLKGGVTNPKELLDNRLGGLVNVTRPDAVTPLAQANLNPFVFQTLEMIKTNNEESTGMSSLSQGTNKDAVSKQNSAAMMEQLVSLGQTRQKIIARNFAEGFLIPFYIKVYNLVLTKEKRQKIVQVAGNWTEVDIQTWKERRSATISLHLGYGEIEREATTRMQLASMIAADPALNRCFELPGRFKMANDVFELKGIHNFLEYLTPPDKVPPPQPDPVQVKMQELEERKIAAMEATAKAATDKVMANAQMDQLTHQLAAMQQQLNAMLSKRENERKDMDIANKIDIAQREMAIVEASPIDSGVASASPR